MHIDEAAGDAGDPAFDAIEPIELAPEEPARRRRRWPRIVVPLVAVAALAGGALALRGGGQPDADELLERAAQAFEDEPSYALVAIIEERTVTGDPDGVGAESTTRSRIDATVDGEDWQVASETAEPYGGGSYTSETIQVDGTQYERSSGFMDEDELEPWVAYPAAPVDEEAALASTLGYLEQLQDEIGDDDFSSMLLAQVRVSLVLAAGEDALASPTAFARLVTDATDPTGVETLPEGGHRLRATLPPPAAFADVEPALPTLAVVLDVDREGRPAAARVDVAEEGLSTSAEITWSDWGAVAPIAPPPDGDIDHTPWIDEEALAALDPSLLLAPTVLPEGYVLLSVDAMEDGGAYGDVEDEDGPCPSLYLDYGLPFDAAELEDEDADWDYLSVEALPSRCGYGEELDEVVGAFPAAIEPGWITLGVGDVEVNVDSSLPDDELLAIAASIAPTTADVLLSTVEEAPADGDWFSYGPGTSFVHTESLTFG